MAKQNQKSKAKVQSTPASQAVVQTPGRKIPNYIPYLLIFLFTCMLYSNTLWNKYAIDDTIVLTDNKFTKKGFGGIKDHFTHDMFEGFFGERGAKLVSGGRYRPLSMTTLAVEYEIVRKIRGDKREMIDEKNIIMTDNDPYLNPALSHGINILLFALTGLVLYYFLLLILPPKRDTPFYFSLPFIITMLYMAHPIHTEAVANIKGRDEVMCMLFSLLTLIATVKYVKTQKIVHLLWGTLIYFIALLSKENAITFLAIIPLTFFFFTNAKAKDYAITMGAIIAPLAVFLYMRSLYTHAGLGEESPEILNNPFIPPYNEFSTHYGTVVYTFLKYYWLLIFPHPLTHDYYFNQIPYVGLGDGFALLSILITAGLVVYALMNLMKKTLPSYGILFFFITFSVASNVAFTVGVLMNERFIYMSSLGFCILLAYLLIKSKDKFKLSSNAVLAIFVLILSLYSLKTFTRNFDWKGSFTLFKNDVQWSPNSAKIQTSLGGDLTKEADRQVDTIERNRILDSSIVHCREAIRIYQTHSNAWLLLGNALYKRHHDAQEVIPVYENAQKCRVGGYYDAAFNLGIVFNDNKQPVQAKDNLLKATAMKPEQVECKYLLAQVYAKLNQPDSVEYWLKKASELRQVEASDYYVIGTNFGKVAGNLNMAIAYLIKAVEKNPKAELYYEDLGVAYGMSGRYDEAIAAAQKLIEINPKYPAAYMNLSVSYRNKGNKELAEQYLQKYNEVVASLNKK